MNKNIIKLIAIVVMIFMLGAVLVACKGEQGETGPKGDTGAAGADGEDGAPGKDGKDGETPTVEISADGYWVINGVKTTVKAEGKDGAPGAPGNNGDNLEDCKDHDDKYVFHTMIPHTEDKYGVNLGVCPDCGDAKYEYDYHTFGADSNVVFVDGVEPTFEEGAKVEVTCEGCSKTITLDVPAISEENGYVLTLGNCMTKDVWTYTFNTTVEIQDKNFAVTASFEVKLDSDEDADTYHSFLDFSDELVGTAWIHIPNTDSSVCPCAYREVYAPVCQNGCNVDFSAPEYLDDQHFADPKGHNYGSLEYTEGDSQWELVYNGDITPCKSPVTYMNVCEDCWEACQNRTVQENEEDECLLYHFESAAPGHPWTTWKHLEGTVATYVRECSVCIAHYEALNMEVDEDAYETVDLAPMLADLPSEVTKEAKCLEDGVRTYTYTHDDNTVIEHEVAIDMLGHNYDATSTYTVEYVDAENGVEGDMKAILHIGCTRCDFVDDVDLGLAYNGNDWTRHYYFENVELGHCKQAFDTIKVTLTGEIEGLGSEETPLELVFSAKNHYSHSVKPELTVENVVSRDLIEVAGEDGYFYYMYQCEYCNSWIIAWVTKTPISSVTPV